MTPPLELFETPGHVAVAGAPEGLDARRLAELAVGLGRPVLHVARDDARMTATAEMVRFFAPGLAVITLPAWDCLPYDRVSPMAEISARRMSGLSRLAAGAAAPLLVLTTVNALLQRLPARAVVAEASFAAEAGQEIDEAALYAYLERNGYSRSGTVMEPGEYAVRGGLIDIFPPGMEEPLRLDLFGDTLESVRRFDALSQRTTGRERRLDLVPVSEVLLDETSINRFRARYREMFGTVTGDDPLYEAVSAGRKHMGMEHWLPLFHERLETLFDYLPDAVVTLDHLAEAAREARLAAIADYYETRQAVYQASRSDDTPVYKPIPPEALYLDQAGWDGLLATRPAAGFTPFHAPDDGRVWNAGGRQGRDFAAERNQPEANVYDALAAHVAALTGAGKRVMLASYSAGARERLAGVARDHGIAALAEVENFAAIEGLPAGTTALAVLSLERGFETDDFALISEQDVLGDRLVRPRRQQRRAENFIAEASQLAQGDLVVHVDHGIGRYDGLETLDVAGAAHDCLLIVYAGGDKLYLPVENIEMLSRFGAGDSEMQLDRLGSSAWQHRKARLKQRLKDMAEELIKIAAARALKDAPRLASGDGLYQEFCARFPYQETDDQSRAITEVLGDLGSGRAMDRLVCGDVGFGKTEVALRSAFISVMAGHQVAVVVPTTLLARQHYRTFTERFAGLPVRIGQLSRMVGAKDARLTRDGLAEGGVDIVIGTHALLGKAVKFRDLGLLIIDEEQHFGVRHKEKLKRLRADVHVLTLTATPIPRTLQLALTGIRELSLIATPPVDRLAVRTFVLPFDPVVAREAVLREHYRGGQSFFVCPRIADLAEVEQFLREHVPEVKFATAHGRMGAGELEDVMAAFYERVVDVLVCTNIIESGLDIPSANTLIVHRSDMFGLAQLYQLRGRIGRSKIRAYAYLTLPPKKKLTPAAEKRLRAMQAMDSLGAGFSLASHDLDIRGAGNLLGEEQSGHIKEVGAELYQHMLEEAVAAARGEGALEAEDAWSPQISLGTAVLIPEDYVADLGVRLELYRRIARLEDRAEIDGFAAEMIDRFGKLPQEVENLLDVVAIKRLCRAANIEKLEAGPRGATLVFRDNRFDNLAGLVDFISAQAGTAKLRPDHTLVYLRGWDTPKERLKGVNYLVGTLAKVAELPT